MIKEFYHDIDMNANQLFNSRLHNITTAARVILGGNLGIGDKGYQVYDTDLLTPYFWDGSAWQAATSSTTWGSITGTLTAQTDLINYLSTNYYPLSTNPAGYLTSETDPVFSAWLSTPPNISIFTNDAGYITSWGPETDPVFTAWLAGPPNVSEFTNDAGYLTSSTVPIPTLDQVLTSGSIAFNQSILLSNSSLYTSSYSPENIYFYNNSYTTLGKSFYIQIGNDNTTNEFNILWAKLNSLSSIYYKTLRPLYSVNQTNNTEYLLPDTNTGLTSITLVSRVNGYTPDNFGNVTIPVGTGTVTSVGLNLGTSGTDLNIGSGTSPVTSSGTITLNVPDASASARGVVNTTTQTFAGQKTFNSDLKVNSYQSMTVGRGPALNSYNIAIGYQALNITSGNSNLAVGDQTLILNTSGQENTAVGQFAMSYNTTGIFNTALGSGAGQGIDTGSRNTAIGWGAIYDPSVKNGLGNTAVGWYAGRRLAGSYNTGIGYTVFGGGAGITSITGVYNTAVGTNAGTGITTGNYNTVIGAQTAIGNVSNNIIIADGQGNVRFKDDATNTILSRLSGVGTRMVVASATGALSTQTIPTGGSSRSVNVVSTNTAAGSTSGTDYVYLVSGTTTITLPTAVGNTNLYTIKRVGTGVVSIATTSSQTIDGSASPININVQYVSLDLISDGTNWNII